MLGKVLRPVYGEDTTDEILCDEEHGLMRSNSNIDFYRLLTDVEYLRE